MRKRMQWQMQVLMNIWVQVPGHISADAGVFHCIYLCKCFFHRTYSYFCHCICPYSCTCLHPQVPVHLPLQLPLRLKGHLHKHLHMHALALRLSLSATASRLAYTHKQDCA